MQTRILLIDDDETLLQVLARALSRRGLEVATARNGEEALRLCDELGPELISLDLKLEQETGLQLLPRLLQIQPDARIVLLTAYASVATAVDAIKLGAVNYLCKPADADQILAAFDYQPGEEHDIKDNPLSVKRLEWEHIQQVLQQNDGNVSATARELGMHRRTLQRKLQKHPVKE